VQHDQVIRYNIRFACGLLSLWQNVLWSPNQLWCLTWAHRENNASGFFTGGRVTINTIPISNFILQQVQLLGGLSFPCGTTPVLEQGFQWCFIEHWSFQNNQPSSVWHTDHKHIFKTYLQTTGKTVLGIDSALIIKGDKQGGTSHLLSLSPFLSHISLFLFPLLLYWSQIKHHS